MPNLSTTPINAENTSHCEKGVLHEKSQTTRWLFSLHKTIVLFVTRVYTDNMEKDPNPMPKIKILDLGRWVCSLLDRRPHLDHPFDSELYGALGETDDGIQGAWLDGER